MRYFVAFALAALPLAGCNTQPDEESGAAQSVPLGSADDAGGEAGDAVNANPPDAAVSNDRSDTMIRGSNDPAVRTPPKNSKLQPAD